MALKAGRVGVRPDQVDVHGKLNPSAVPTEIPSHSSADAGKVLCVDDEGNLEFDNIPTELPEYSSSDSGKVLSVDEEGDLEFKTPEGGVDLYQHCVALSHATTHTYINVIVLSDSPTGFTKATFFEWLSNNGFDRTSGKQYPCVGYSTYQSINSVVIGIRAYNDNYFDFFYQDFENNKSITKSDCTLQDKVINLGGN